MRTRLRALVPGTLMCATIAAAATFLSEHYGAPVMLFALLIGMAFHFLSQDGPCVAGIGFSATALLRIGVGLLGVRITFDQIASLGAGPIALVVVCSSATILVGIAATRLAGKDLAFGVLTGGAVAICGASAALAISAALPPRQGAERSTLFTVMAVTGLSTLAMIVYPILFKVLEFSDTASGILIGATIHDVAQVVGAGFAISDEAGNLATYVKLVRVAMLPLVVVVISLATPGGHRGGKPKIPLFTLGFAAMMTLNSLGMFPEPVRLMIANLSVWLLVAAIAALGMKTSIKSMLELGPSNISIVLGETLFLLFIAIFGVTLIV